MNPTEIIERMTTDGLTLSVSEDGNLKILGDQNMVNSWIETIKENKAAILVELQNWGKTHIQGQNKITGNVTGDTIEDDQPAILPLDNGVGKKVESHDGIPLSDHEEFAELSGKITGLDKSRYSMTVTDASTDPVLAEVTIAGQASFTLEIPLQL